MKSIKIILAGIGFILFSIFANNIGWNGFDSFTSLGGLGTVIIGLFTKDNK